MDGEDPAFGVLLRRHRERAGLTQEALAEQAGLAPSAVAALERGRRRRPYPDTVQRLADALALSTADRAQLGALARRIGGVPNVGAPAADAILSRRRASLPVPLTSFVGRERELTAAALLLAGGTRLLTLTGPGGAGKTRLALAVAEQVRDNYPDGVAFVDLSPVADASLVAATIAQALELREGEGQPVAGVLVDFLRDKRLLLVLDNFEQVVTAAPLLTDLLAAGPGLTLLVTSRVPLRLSGEREYGVPPLPLPDEQHLLEPAALAAVPAVALFVQRAQAARAGFVLTEANAPAVAAICARVDGLPLALELAAARVRILSPKALLVRLDQRLPLLTGGARDVPVRQQTLRNTIAWSYDLLSPAEQTLFRQLGVFAGGCTIASVTAVAGDLPAAEGGGASVAAPIAELDVLDQLGALVEQSLLHQEDGPDGEPRFQLLMTVREFALEQLAAAGETAAVRSLHAAWCLALAEEAASASPGPLDEGWLDRLEREHDNLRGALDWLVQTGDADRAVQLAGAMWRFWSARAYLREGRDRLVGALALGGGSIPVRAHALEGAGYLLSNLGEPEAAVRLLEEAVALRRKAGDQLGLLMSLNWLGNVLIWSDPDRAYAIHSEVLASRRTSADERAIAGSVVNLGVAALARGDAAEATRLLEQAVTGATQVSTGYGRAVTHIYLAWAAIVRGDTERAAGWLREGLPYLGTFRHLNHVCLIAAVLAAAERPDDAVRLFAAGDAATSRSGGSTIPASSAAVGSERLRALRAALDEETFAATWAEGQALSFDAAFALALTALDATADAGARTP